VVNGPEQLYRDNLPLVAYFTRRFSPPRGTEWGDLRQQARLALWDAATSYDPARGAAFRTHAINVITRRLSFWVKRRKGQEERHERAYSWQPELVPWEEPDLDGQLRLGIVWRRLNPRHQEALLLGVGYGYGSHELAARWGCTPRQAENLITNAKKAARRAAVREGAVSR
jgi:RNA polymerase sigma factor (sigma-70 family)